MGNRAYVVFESGKERSPAVYLHWNGGPESIYAFLHALNTYETDQHSPAYSCARMDIIRSCNDGHFLTATNKETGPGV